MNLQSTEQSPSFPFLTGWARRFGVLITISALGMLFAGCGLGGSSSSSSSRVRTLNAYIPANGVSNAISVSAGSTALTNGISLSFGQFSNGGGYVSTPSGAFSPIATGTGIPTSITPLTPTTLNGNNAAYSIIVAGEIGQTGALTPQIFVLPNYTTDVIAIPSGSAAVRVVNVSLVPNPIGVYNTSSGAPVSVLNPNFTSVSYGYSAAANGYSIVPLSQLANFAIVDSTATGTALSLSNTSTLNNYIFISGQAYTLYVFGQPGNSAEPLTASWYSDYPVL